MSDQIVPVTQEEAQNLKTVHTLSSKRAIVIFVVFFIAQEVIAFGFGVVVGFYMAVLQGITDSVEIAEAMEPFNLSIGIIGLFFSALIVFRMTRKTFSVSTNSGGLATIGWQRSSVQQISTAVLTGCVVALFYLFVLVPTYPVPESQHWGPLTTAASLGGWPRIQWAFLALFLAPPIEEFVFRGVLFSGLSKSLGSHASAVIVTVLFMLVHTAEALTYWPAWVGIGMLAVATILIRIRTKSLLPAVAAHAGYNLVLVISVFSGIA